MRSVSRRIEASGVISRRLRERRCYPALRASRGSPADEIGLIRDLGGLRFSELWRSFVNSFEVIAAGRLRPARLQWLA